MANASPVMVEGAKLSRADHSLALGWAGHRGEQLLLPRPPVRDVRLSSG